MNKAFKYRIYPTKEQEQFLNKELGLCRLYYNLILNAKKENSSVPILSYKQTFQAYRPEALEWMKEIDSTCLAEQWNNIKSAFSNFFSFRKGSRKGFIGYPKFKSKKSKQSIGYSNNVRLKFIKGKLLVSRKFGLLKGSFHRFAKGKLKKCTISKTSTNKWYISILVDCKPEKKNLNKKFIGIDWNCRDNTFLTFSDGTKVKCPRLLKKRQSRIIRIQKHLSRCQKESNNYEKTRIKLANLHEKVVNQRTDFLHKISRLVVNNFQYICVEDINLQKMAHKLHHGTVIGDQGFGMFRSMLAYKGALIKVPAPFTSKTCSRCGTINENIVVGIEHWTCQHCGCNHDRDINAAKNIERLGRIQVLGEPEEFKPVEFKVTRTKKQESSNSWMNISNAEDHSKIRRHLDL